MQRPTSLPPLDQDNKPFLDALQLAEHTTSCLYLTGKAGTGKSTFLRYFTANTRKKYVVLAPTGIAAINVGGQTIHSLFGFPFEPITPKTHLPFFPDVKHGDDGAVIKPAHPTRNLLRNLDIIIIDEISMVRADVFDAIDRSLRANGGNPFKPFGGKQLIVIGDLFQLPPVLTGEQEQIYKTYYESSYFFSAKAYPEANFVQVCLEKPYRQKPEERQFIGILDRVRENEATREDLHALNLRYQPDFAPPPDQPYITLTTTNQLADRTNQARLDALPGELVVYEGRKEGEFPALPTALNLELKEGAQVMFVRNDPGPPEIRRWANGTIGRVATLGDGYAEVDIEDGGQTRRVWVETVDWEHVSFTWDPQKEEITRKVLGTFSQLPLRLAWAVTIHKSQGLTFDRVVLELGRGTFAAGQLYVALSRCTSLGGLVLRSPILQQHIITDERVTAFAREGNNPQVVSQHLLSGLTEQIAVLETRVAELEAENAQLRELLSSN